MSRATTVAAMAQHEMPFRVESIARTTSPDGAEGTWYQYVIAQGVNRITGVRSGEQAEVTSLVGEMVEQLNLRRAGKNGRKA